MIFVIDGCDIFGEVALKWMSLVRTYDKSTLVQVMAWCRQTTSRYLSQCWPRSVLPYGIIRPQWVKQEEEQQNKKEKTQENLVETYNLCVFYIVARIIVGEWIDQFK